MLITQVKATGVQHLTDARYFAAWYADWLGFGLDPKSASAVRPAQVSEMRAWLSGVQAVGEFGFAQSADEIIAMATELQLDAVQLPYFYSLEAGQKILASGCPIFKYVHFSDDAAETLAYAENWQHIADYFVLDLSTSQFAAFSDWTADTAKAVETFINLYPTFLQMDFLPQDLQTLLLTLPNLKGLQLQGGAEERVGLKSFDELDAIFDELMS
jgi:phosphoribosylanthranilate isomerase